MPRIGAAEGVTRHSLLEELSYALANHTGFFPEGGDHASLANLDYASAGHTGFPTGVEAHSLLTELAYALSGHTGFFPAGGDHDTLAKLAYALSGHTGFFPAGGDHDTLAKLAYALSGHTGFFPAGGDHDTLAKLAYADAGHTGFARGFSPAYFAIGWRTADVGMVANYGYFFVVINPFDISIATVAIGITIAGAAGTLGQVAIYDSAGTTKLATSADIALSATGRATAALSYTLPAGTYWVAYSGNGAPTINAFRAANLFGTGYHGGAINSYPLPSAVPSLDSMTPVPCVVFFS